MNLKNKTIVITGASGGIGQALARSLYAKNAKLVLVGRNIEKLEQLNNELGGQNHVIRADLAVQNDRKNLLVACEKMAGVDILINNAGISHFALFDEMTEQQIEQTITTNLVSPMLLTQDFMPLLKRASNSIVFNVGSTFGGIGYPGFTAYCASKFGMKGFSEALKRELKDTSVEVLYIAPRATQTEINSQVVDHMNNALGNTTDAPQLVANAIVKQLEGEVPRVAIGWPEKLFLKVNGLFPLLVDNALSKQLVQIKSFASKANKA